MKKRMKNAELKDYIKACRKAGREEEIAAHGRPVAVFRIHKSKKAYDRKRMKAADKKSLPFFIPSLSNALMTDSGSLVSGNLGIRLFEQN